MTAAASNPVQMRRPRLGIFALALVLVAAVFGGLWLAARLPARLTVGGPIATRGDPPAGMPVHGQAESPVLGAVPEAVRLTPAIGETDSVAELGALAGRVVCADTGMSVPEAEVTLLKEGAVHSVVTGADGRFLFLAPKAGHYELASVSAEGFADFSPRLGQSPVIFEARPKLKVRDVVIYLSELVTLPGRVVDEEARPVAGASVTARPGDLVGFDFMTAPTVRSDTQGEFQIQVAGPVQLVAQHPDYLGGRAWIDAADARRVSRGGRLVPVVIVLMARAEGTSLERIAGTVVDPANTPVEAALVELAPSAHGDRHRGGAGSAVLTDAAGRFELSVVSAGAETYTVTATAKGFGEVRAKAVRADGVELTLKLAKGVSLIGAVTGKRGGRPVAAFSLLFAGRDRSAGGRTLSFLDADGRYEVAGLPAGKARVRVAAFGFAPSAEAEVVIPAVGGPVIHDVSLERGSRAHGVVIDAVERSPVVAARIAVEGEFASDGEVVPVQSLAVTNERGEFSLEGVAIGLRSISVAATGYHKRLISGLAAEADGDIGPLTIDLTPVGAGETPKTELTGIGAALGQTAEGFEILNVGSDGGAERVGIVRGDLIVAIDGTPAASLDLAAAVERIRGEEGSVIRLTVRRADGTQVELAVVRRRVLY
jgi:hypothetical protein